MPTRLLREGILTSDRVDALDYAAEVFYRRLMSKVDDHGLLDARPSVLRAELYPLRLDRVREADITRWIATCEKSGVIALYQSGGKPYLRMLDTKWQTRSAPKYPLPPSAGDDDSSLQTVVNSCKQLQTAVHLDVDVDVDVDDIRPQAAVCDWKSGLDPDVVRDFTTLRKAKKAAITKTAIAGIRREAEKAGLTLEQALRTCCERGWTGFKAEWVRASGVSGQPQPRRRRDLDAEADAMRARMGAAA